MRTKPKIHIDPARIEQLAATGASLDDIARVLGVSESTIRNRRRESAEFQTAYERGRSTARTAYANALREIALKRGPDGEYAYETKYRLKAITFFLERQQGWAKKHDVDMQSSDGSMSPSQIDLGDRPLGELLDMTREACDGAEKAKARSSGD